MAYFSNGTEGDLWQHDNCDRCRNWKSREGEDPDNVGCPIWDAHILYAYEGCNDELGRGILRVLIPEVKSAHGDYKVAGRCAMFEPEGRRCEAYRPWRTWSGDRGMDRCRLGAAHKGPHEFYAPDTSKAQGS